MKSGDQPKQQFSSSGKVVTISDFGDGLFEVDLSKTLQDLSEVTVSGGHVEDLSEAESGTRLVSLDSPSDPPDFKPGSSLPLVDVLKVIGSEEEPKFFSGLQVVGLNPAGDSVDQFEVQWALYFAGRSLTPNATIKVVIRDEVGIEVLSAKTHSDDASFWAVSIPVDGEEEVETIEVVETPEKWEGDGEPVKTIFPFEPNPPTPEQAGKIKKGQVFGGVSIGERAF